MVKWHHIAHRSSSGGPVITPWSSPSIVEGDSVGAVRRYGASGKPARAGCYRETLDEEGGAAPTPPCDGYASIPAIEAEVKAARFPATIARSPKEAMSRFRSGANPPIPPIWIAIEEKFAKPRSA